MDFSSLKWGELLAFIGIVLTAVIAVIGNRRISAKNVALAHELERLKSETALEISNATTGTELLKDTRIELRDLRDRLVQYDKEIQIRRDQVATVTDEKHELRDKFQKEFLEIAVAHEKFIAQLNLEHQEAMNTLSNNCEKSIAELKQGYEKKIAELEDRLCVLEGTKDKK